MSGLGFRVCDLVFEDLEISRLRTEAEIKILRKGTGTFFTHTSTSWVSTSALVVSAEAEQTLDRLVNLCETSYSNWQFVHSSLIAGNPLLRPTCHFLNLAALDPET